MTPQLGDRSLFPDLAATAYLNHAAISPPSVRVRAVALQVVDDYARHGVAAFGHWMEQRERLRAQMAALLGARPEDLGFVANTTTGVIHTSLCLPWRAGDRVVCFEGEFPTNVTPWQRAADTFELELVMLPLIGFGDRSGVGLARLEAELRRGVRLVAVSAVQFSTGLAMPLAAMAQLCHAYGAELFVDAIQAVGIVPLDVRALGIDYLVTGSHKWLMGLEGCAVLYVAPEPMAALVPRVAGWLSHEQGLEFLFQGRGHLRYDRPIKSGPDAFEAGAYNTLGLAALEAAVGPLLELGVPNIAKHVTAYLDRLEPELQALGFCSWRAEDPAARSGILSVVPPDGVDGAALQHALGEAGVSVSYPDGNLRFAPHWPNALSEVDGVVDAAREAL